jgi:hypothetical protein
MVAISGKKHKSFVGSPAASVANLKFIAELEILNAGPSTTFVAKNAPNSAQDDNEFLVRTSEMGPIEFVQGRRSLMVAST